MSLRSIGHFGLAMFIVVASHTLTRSCAAQCGQQAKNGSSKREDEEVSTGRAPVRWELLEFYIAEGGGVQSRRIRRVKVTLLDKQTAPWGRSFVGDEELTYNTKEPVVLEAVEAFLWEPLRMAVPEGLHGARGDGSSSCVGTIRIYPTRGQSFPIGISYVGFVLNSDSADLQNIFYSWGVAHFLDKLCAKHAGRRVPPAVMKTLTGEARMESDRETFAPIKNHLEK